MKRGFLNKPNASSSEVPKTSNSAAAATFLNIYDIPTTISTTHIAGQDAPIQTFGLPTSDPADVLKEALILLNLDLGPNSGQKDKIPMWIYPKSVEMLNQMVGTPEDSKAWGEIQAIPNLGGLNGTGEGVLWGINNVEHKGMGVFALETMELGDLIISERSILITLAVKFYLHSMNNI